MSIRTPNDFDKIAKDIMKAASQSLKIALNEGRNEAVRRAPVDTGIMQGSIRRVMVDEFSGYLAVLGKGYYDTDDEDKVNYAYYVEYGTVKMTARPFMHPGMKVAIDTLEKVFAKKVSDIYRKYL